MTTKPFQILRLSSLLGLAWLLAACASDPVTVDYDQSIDFKAIHSYQWYSERSGVGENFDPLIADRVQSAIKQQLGQRQWVERPEGSGADVKVRYFVANSAETKSSNSNASVGLGSFGGSSAFGVSLGFPLGGDRIVRQAQIIIDLMGVETSKLMWRGATVVKLDNDPIKVTGQIEAAVADILSRFPPQP
ncbi:MAG TPA: DUF4136 domain-containing protein [Spongiibacteraceae bacterium]|jgi:hypothetical protein|nr:DUF4136 domain-containing protein [Spongiibacteraceae bacterium]HUH36558.1 DUF4136 domain-containing protein [Spongiibacteraceae bacterium]